MRVTAAACGVVAVLVARTWSASSLAMPPGMPPVVLRAHADPAQAESRLAKLAARVADHDAALRLDEPDVPGHAVPLTPVTQQVIDADRSFRNTALNELADIEPVLDQLRASARGDAVVLRARLERVGIDRDERRRFESDPAYVLPRIDGCLRVLLKGRPGVLCHRLAPAIRRLREVPEVLRAAKIGLAHPSRLAVDFAIERFQQTLSLYRRDMPASLTECRESGSMASFAQADTLAARALERHIDWLRTVALEHADGEWSMGEERFTRWLGAMTGDTTSLVALRRRAERELAAMAADSGAARPSLSGDSIRVRSADKLLASRASQYGRASSRWLRTVAGRRELALAWADYSGVRQAAPKQGTQPVEFRRTRRDLVGLLVELDLHAGAANIDGARRRFEHDAGLDSAAAAREAQSCALEPTHAATVITAWQLSDLGHEALATVGPKLAPEAFLREVIDAGAVPVPAVREEVLRRLKAWPPRVFAEQ